MSPQCAHTHTLPSLGAPHTLFKVPLDLIQKPGPQLLRDRLFFLMASPAVHGSSQARGQIRAAAAGHSHGNTESKPIYDLRSVAMPRPYPNERGQRSNPHPHTDKAGSLTH